MHLLIKYLQEWQVPFPGGGYRDTHRLSLPYLDWCFKQGVLSGADNW